jgi:succinate dehydrogenase (ubiquinone) membrane anchor subunit
MSSNSASNIASYVYRYYVQGSSCLKFCSARYATSDASVYVPGGRECNFISFCFHSGLKHRELTAVYKGTVNDPTTFPPPSRSAGSYHWAFERLLSAGLVPLTVAAFVTSGTNYPVLDGVLGVSLIMHSHIGVRATLIIMNTN